MFIIIDSIVNFLELMANNSEPKVWLPYKNVNVMFVLMISARVKQTPCSEEHDGATCISSMLCE